MRILAIESSCDETAAAIVENGVTELAYIIASSKELHEATGGVVPEIAARKQIEFIVPVIDHTLQKSNLSPSDIDALAVTVGPGLIGSLLVGVEAAKALALAWNKPLIPVNHLIGHIYGNFLLRKTQRGAAAITFPCVVLIISGGHTDLVLMRGHGDFEFIGGTLDDAAGEAYDKTARLLGLAKYLGGAELSRLAATCADQKAQGVLPRPMINSDDFDFSFSGLKTAVKNLIDKNLYPAHCVAREFEDAVVEVVVAKTVKAAKKYGCTQILVGGGVSANKFLRQSLIEAANAENIEVLFPDFDLCTDNAIYIASAAYFNYNPKALDQIVADPSLGLMDVV
jgi:N6-L-threonylcarbamoyladenine synthase